MQVLHFSPGTPVKVTAAQIKGALTPRHWRSLLASMVAQAMPVLPAAHADPGGPAAAHVAVRPVLTHGLMCVGVWATMAALAMLLTQAAYADPSGAEAARAVHPPQLLQTVMSHSAAGRRGWQRRPVRWEPPSACCAQRCTPPS